MVLTDTLSIVGHMIHQLIQQVKDKTGKLTLLAQTPPTLLEWMRKQVNNDILLLEVDHNLFSINYAGFNRCSKEVHKIEASMEFCISNIKLNNTLFISCKQGQSSTVRKNCPIITTLLITVSFLLYFFLHAMFQFTILFYQVKMK